MSLTWIIAVAVAVAAAAVYVVWALAARSSAGIHTSRVGRLIRVMAGSARMIARLLRRRLVRLFLSRERRAAHDAEFHDRTARQVVATMGNMKGVFMKLGQIISFMDELVPEAAATQLRALQSSAPPMPYEVVAEVVADELGRSPETLFADFDREPMAAASIGQVHRALLHDGSDVVVKVQYPGVDQAITADLNNLGMVVTAIGAVTPTLDAKPIAEELRERLLDELDYRLEAEHQDLFAELYAGDEEIVVPRVIHERSSARVLTTTYAPGVDLYEFVASADASAKRRAALAIRRFVFDSIWYHHVFNGDPHPGNYRFSEDGTVAFLDYGCVKRFNPTFIRDFKALNRAYLEGRRDDYYEIARRMGFIVKGKERVVDRDWLWDFVRWFYEPILEDQPFAIDSDYCRKSVAQVFGDNMRKVNMPAEYLMLNRITFGFNSIMAKLEARENWRRLSLPYYYDETPGAGAALEAPER